MRGARGRDKQERVRGGHGGERERARVRGACHCQRTSRAAARIASHLQRCSGAYASQVVWQVRLELTHQRVYALRELLKGAGRPDVFCAVRTGLECRGFALMKPSHNIVACRRMRVCCCLLATRAAKLRHLEQSARLAKLAAVQKLSTRASAHQAIHDAKSAFSQLCCNGRHRVVGDEPPELVGVRACGRCVVGSQRAAHCRLWRWPWHESPSGDARAVALQAQQTSRRCGHACYFPAGFSREMAHNPV